MTQDVADRQNQPSVISTLPPPSLYLPPDLSRVSAKKDTCPVAQNEPFRHIHAYIHTHIQRERERENSGSLLGSLSLSLSLYVVWGLGFRERILALCWVCGECISPQVVKLVHAVVDVLEVHVHVWPGEIRGTRGGNVGGWGFLRTAARGT